VVSDYNHSHKIFAGDESHQYGIKLMIQTETNF